MRWIAVATMAMIASPASAADWYQVTSSNEYVGYVDAASIRVGAVYVEFWEKVVFRHPNNGSKRWLVKSRMSCRDQTEAMLSAILYDDNGKAITSLTIPDYQIKTNYIAPETNSDFKMKFICGDKNQAPHVENPESDAAEYFDYLSKKGM